jgi:hypothetical protein
MFLTALESMETVGQASVAVNFDGLRVRVGEELDRVLSSEYFRNSKQAERLLRYLVANSLDAHDEQLRERVIGEKVFGRPPKYDSNSDSIVRVWANHLRKRLAQYYETEGRNSGMRFSMPTGSYRIEFQPIPVAVPVAEVEITVSAPKPARLSAFAVASGVAGILALVCVWLVFQNVQLRNQVRGGKAQPPLNLLWSRMLGGKLPTELVLADSNLSLFQDLLHKPLTLQEYIQHNYLLMNTDPSAALLMQRRYTSTADVDVLRRALLMAGAESNRLEVSFARDFSSDDLKSRNVILVGSKRSNPWAEPFEAHMNFHFDYVAADGVGVIVNTHPRPGEQSGFMVPRPMEETRESYGLLAFQPNLAHNGSVLLIAGLGMQGTLAAGELATSPELFKQVVEALGAKVHTELPYFEVVLKAEMMGSTVHGFKIVAWRSS